MDIEIPSLALHIGTVHFFYFFLAYLVRVRGDINLKKAQIGGGGGGFVDVEALIRRSAKTENWVIGSHEAATQEPSKNERYNLPEKCPQRPN